MQNAQPYGDVDGSSGLPLAASYPHEEATTLNRLMTSLLLAMAIVSIVLGGIISALP
jgi:hypothetical protein